jgi:UDP-N-acetylglucosamine--dolichyl-phosphate N-acetylglucosaminephosphotransferase
MIFRIGAPAFGRNGWSNVAIGILIAVGFRLLIILRPKEIISFIIGSHDPAFMLPSGWEVTTAVLLAIVSFPVSLVLTRFFMKVNAKRGIVGIDVHKLNKPRIPEMCGASIPITLILLSTAYVLIGGGNGLMMLAFSLVVGSAAVVGALDDRLKMRGIYKPLLTLLCGLPIVALGLLYPNQVYNPTLQVPIFGSFHLPVIYPLSIPVAISVTSNTTNMLDPLNGTMAGGVSIISTALLIGILLTDPAPGSVFLFACLLFTALGFFYFNRYPSRAFAGNVGQLSVGAALGALAILSRSEIASIVAMFPNIQNSFFFLSKIKRFTEHRALTAKPTRLLDDGRLASSSDPKAPLTLVRTLLVGRPAKESETVSTIFGLYLISAALALITMILIG